MISATPSWLAPTRRAIDWTALTLIAATLLATAAVLGGRTIDVPAEIQHLAVAALSAAGVLGLADPARPLLQALPTSALTRLAHRASLLVAATAFVIVLLVAAARVLSVAPTAGPDLAAALFALSTAGMAVYAVCNPFVECAHEIGAGSILLWVASLSLPFAFIPDVVRAAWLQHPWRVTASATAVIIYAMTRRSAR